MPGCRDIVEKIRAGLREVTPCEAMTAKAAAPTTILLDVREESEWLQGHVDGAFHLSRGFLEPKVEQIIADKATPVICYCRSGVRSLFAVRAMAELGYTNVSSMASGYMGWKEAGYPIAVPGQPVSLRGSNATEAISHPPLTPSQFRIRYGRHLTLPEVGEAGQQKILAAKVLMLGAGGLGCSAAYYLAAAGVGTIGIVDPDRVEESNLQRQILHTTDRLGAFKVDSAREQLLALNPHITIDTHRVQLNEANVAELITPYDMIIDGCDNLPTRYALNDAAVKAGKPVVHGSILRFEGRVTVFAPEGPCYRCLYPEPPDACPSCAEAGVLGVLPGVIGTLQATEAIKWILGAGELLVGRLLMYDALLTSFKTLQLARDPQCPICAH